MAREYTINGFYDHRARCYGYRAVEGSRIVSETHYAPRGRGTPALVAKGLIRAEMEAKGYVHFKARG